MKISDKINFRENNFDFLRLLAALFVIQTHSHGLSEIEGDLFNRISGYDSLGRLGVNIFFIISGFLITKSWLDKPIVFTFFKKRFLRIFPGLCSAVIFGAFVIGPLVTSLSLKEYILNPQTFNYLQTMILVPPLHFAFTSLPGVFVDNHTPNFVNGSLWTLFAEVIMYLLIVILGLLGIYKKRNIVILICGVSILFYFFIPILTEFSKLGIFFLFGSIIYLFRDKIIFNNKLAFLFFLLWVFSFNTSMGLFVNFFSLSYLIIYVAFIRIPLINNFSKYGDFSYGMYIYAFPIQQSILHFYSNNITLWSFSFYTILITFLVAFLSWKYIEKPSLKLK